LKALYVASADGRGDSWLTHNREYQVLSVQVATKGPAELRIIADNGTPILVAATMFAMCPESPPPNWVVQIRENGVVDFGPLPWLELGFWERYFDRDPDAIAVFGQEVTKME
jgi:hypothetical protein